MLWQHLRGRKLQGFKFRRQQPLGNYVVDFVCPEAMLVIEVDGGQHGQDQNLSADRARTRFLTGAGYRVLRFWNSDVSLNIEGAVMEVERWLFTPHLGSLPQRERQ
jgi:very-short-patch-repair endonuclease